MRRTVMTKEEVKAHDGIGKRPCRDQPSFPPSSPLSRPPPLKIGRRRKKREKVRIQRHASEASTAWRSQPRFSFPFPPFPSRNAGAERTIQRVADRMVRDIDVAEAGRPSGASRSKAAAPSHTPSYSSPPFLSQKTVPKKKDDGEIKNKEVEIGQRSAHAPKRLRSSTLEYRPMTPSPPPSSSFPFSLFSRSSRINPEKAPSGVARKRNTIPTQRGSQGRSPHARNIAF